MDVPWQIVLSVSYRNFTVGFGYTFTVKVFELNTLKQLSQVAHTVSATASVVFLILLMVTVCEPGDNPWPAPIFIVTVSFPLPTTLSAIIKALSAESPVM